MKLYLKHKLTAYHLRDLLDKQKPSRIFLCECGWKPRWARTSLRYRAKEAVCFFRGHEWGEPYSWEGGPVGFEDGEGDIQWSQIQCDRCLKVENHDN